MRLDNLRKRFFLFGVEDGPKAAILKTNTSISLVTTLAARNRDDRMCAFPPFLYFIFFHPDVIFQCYRHICINQLVTKRIGGLLVATDSIIHSFIRIPRLVMPTYNDRPTYHFLFVAVVLISEIPMNVFKVNHITPFDPVGKRRSVIQRRQRQDTFTELHLLQTYC